MNTRPAEQRYRNAVNLRLNDRQLDLLQAQARKAQQTPGAYMRALLEDRARVDLQRRDGGQGQTDGE